MINTIDEIIADTHHTLALKLGFDELNRESKTSLCLSSN